MYRIIYYTGRYQLRSGSRGLLKIFGWVGTCCMTRYRNLSAAAPTLMLGSQRRTGVTVSFARWVRGLNLVMPAMQKMDAESAPRVRQRCTSVAQFVDPFHRKTFFQFCLTPCKEIAGQRNFVKIGRIVTSMYAFGQVLYAIRKATSSALDFRLHGTTGRTKA